MLVYPDYDENPINDTCIISLGLLGKFYIIKQYSSIPQAHKQH